MSVLSQLVLAAVVVVTVVGSLTLLARNGFFEPDDVNEQSQQEREELSDSIGNEDFSIPYRDRVSAWSGPYKALVGSIVLLVIGGGVATWQMLKTGSPAEQYLTTEMRTAAVAVIGVGGGVWLRGWFEAQIGRLIVVYERAGQANLVDVVEYAKTGVRRQNGNVTVPEVASNRLLGLFWRYRQVGEDRRLRSGEKPLSDVVNHLVPDHANELPNGEGWAVQTSADGDRIITGASSTADLAYGSPNTLSDEQATKNRGKLERKNAVLSATKATNAELTQQYQKMQKKLKNEEYAARSELIDDFDRFSEMFQRATLEAREESASGSSGPIENGSKPEASS